MNLERDVESMYRYYGLLTPRVNESGAKLGLSYDEKNQRAVMLQEELDEYVLADNPVDEYDALIDLMVFAVGGLVQSNYPLEPAWNAVMAANLSKVVGETKRGFAADLIKPANWQDPKLKLEEILYMTTGYCSEDSHPRFGNLDNQTVDNVVKDDSGKTRYELIPFDSLKAIADVFAYGADKYYDNSWRTQTPAEYSRTFGSIMRHLTQWFIGEDVDPESSHSHLAHAATQIMMLMHVAANFQDRDDRIKESR